MSAILKYPRTQHIEGSRTQPGDEDLDTIPFEELSSRYLVIEEKIDGANCGISFDDDGTMRLQSRGHFLTGGARERHFNLFKQWAQSRSFELREILSNRYIAFGEWMYAKHTVFYDDLPHYFLEFDVYDNVESCFLSTERRRALWTGAPVVSVSVLHEGPLESLTALKRMIGPSLFISDQWRERLIESCERLGLDPQRALDETATNNMMEGLYIKAEDAGRVTGRYKFVRFEFLNAVVDSGSHWLKRPIIPNRLRDTVNILGDR